jgi:hypothetical protein
MSVRNRLAGQDARQIGGGADSMQALLGALKIIGSDIVASTYYASGEITLNGSYRGCGFPVPNSIRDTLRGDDAKFS